MLRITVNDRPEGPVMFIEGRLTAASVDLLPEDGAAATLDLGGITFVDRPAAAALARLARQGARLLNVPPLVRLLIEGAPS
ncbi:MAG: hypothetical protein AB7O28_00930 [Vicinamibacterales bacterium]